MLRTETLLPSGRQEGREKKDTCRPLAVCSAGACRALLALMPPHFSRTSSMDDDTTEVDRLINNKLVELLQARRYRPHPLPGTMRSGAPQSNARHAPTTMRAPLPRPLSMKNWRTWSVPLCRACSAQRWPSQNYPRPRPPPEGPLMGDHAARSSPMTPRQVLGGACDTCARGARRRVHEFAGRQPSSDDQGGGRKRQG